MSHISRYISAGMGAKYNSKCNEYGDIGHWAGNPDYPKKDNWRQNQTYKKGRNGSCLSKPARHNETEIIVDRKHKWPDQGHDKMNFRFMSNPDVGNESKKTIQPSPRIFFSN